MKRLIIHLLLCVFFAVTVITKALASTGRRKYLNEPLPFNDRKDAHANTQTDGSDICSTL